MTACRRRRRSSTAPVTAWLYQPFESGARLGATVAVGEEVSTSIVYGCMTRADLVTAQLTVA